MWLAEAEMAQDFSGFRGLVATITITITITLTMTSTMTMIFTFTIAIATHPNVFDSIRRPKPDSYL